MQVKFADFNRQYHLIKKDIDQAVHRVLDSDWYILGKEVEAFETEFARYLGVNFAVGCASGTEAIALALMALDIGLGDEVLTVPNTAVPTATAITMTGAEPVFVDINKNTLMMDTDKVEEQLTERTKAILPVHLYGSSVDLDSLSKVAEKFNIPIVEDCAQSCGTEYFGRKTGSIGKLGAFSFYPSKNLGCYGDGGAVVTDDAELYNKLVMLRNYGQEKRYFHSINGINSRLDEIQAAVLRVKLGKLEEWNNRRREIADIYKLRLKSLPLSIPETHDGVKHIYHLIVIRSKNREQLIEHLSNNGIQTLIHYPIPVHLQKAYTGLGNNREDFPVCEKAATEILSIPMWPELNNDEVEYVCEKITKFFI